MRYKRKKGEPIKFELNGSEMMGIFHSQENDWIKVILINNSFDKSEIITIHKTKTK